MYYIYIIYYIIYILLCYIYISYIDTIYYIYYYITVEISKLIKPLAFIPLQLRSKMRIAHE